MTTDPATIIIQIGNHIPEEGEKFYSGAEWKISKDMYNIAFETHSSIIWSMVLKKTQEQFIKIALLKSVPWHQIDFVLIHDTSWTAVEIDGMKFHGTFVDDLKDADLLLNGWNVVRIKAGYALRHTKIVSNILSEFIMKNERGKYLQIPEENRSIELLMEKIETEAALRFMVDGPVMKSKVGDFL